MPLARTSGYPTATLRHKQVATMNAFKPEAEAAVEVRYREPQPGSLHLQQHFQFRQPECVLSHEVTSTSLDDRVEMGLNLLELASGNSMLENRFQNWDQMSVTVASCDVNGPFTLGVPQGSPGTAGEQLMDNVQRRVSVRSLV